MFFFFKVYNLPLLCIYKLLNFENNNYRIKVVILLVDYILYHQLFILNLIYIKYRYIS